MSHVSQLFLSLSSPLYTAAFAVVAIAVAVVVVIAAVAALSLSPSLSSSSSSSSSSSFLSLSSLLFLFFHFFLLSLSSLSPFLLSLSFFFFSFLLLPFLSFLFLFFFLSPLSSATGCRAIFSPATPASGLQPPPPYTATASHHAPLPSSTGLAPASSRHPLSSFQPRFGHLAFLLLLFALASTSHALHRSTPSALRASLWPAHTVALLSLCLACIELASWHRSDHAIHDQPLIGPRSLCVAPSALTTSPLPAANSLRLLFFRIDRRL